MENESLNYDVVIVGAGPSGLSAAIRLKQLSIENNKEISICILEKAASIGGHSISGAVFEPTALNELIPKWQELNNPLQVKVTEDNFLFLSKQKSFPLPLPETMRNQANYIISLGELCSFLASHAEDLGIDIFPGFAVKECLFDEHDEVCGVKTVDMGLDKNGNKTENFTEGVKIYAKRVCLSEGCRGHISKQIIAKYKLNSNCDPQTYAIGLKEIWQVDNTNYKQGKVIHTLGWPLDSKTYGGGFIYHSCDNKITVGIVIGLDYQNPYLNPYEELQRFKTHPTIKKYLANGTRIAYGARSLTEGGYQAIGQCYFPGGVIVGEAAGFMNVAKIKGNHTAMKSGMLAAEAIMISLNKNSLAALKDYQTAIKQSWLGKELYLARNIRPGFHKGLIPGIINAAIDSFILKGRAPWTLKHRADHLQLKPKTNFKPIEDAPKDGKLTFDLLTSVSLTNVYHNENQPCHLLLKDKSIPIEYNLKNYEAPETRYCPAGVYEIVDMDNKPYLQINSQNCIHCKTCDIKDPKQNINWTVPESGGPNYSGM